MKLLLYSDQPPGDILMLTALVRDLKKRYPQHELRISAGNNQSLFDNNPHIVIPPKPELKVLNTNAEESKDREDTTDEGWFKVKVNYCETPQFGETEPVKNIYSIHKSGEHKKHFVYSMIGYLNALYNLDIKLTAHKGDVHLTEEEKAIPVHLKDLIPKGKFWVVFPGGKTDNKKKIWHSKNWHKLFELMHDVTFVQVGSIGENYINPVFDLSNVINIVGSTNLRNILSLIHCSEGVISPITFGMHAAAALDKHAIVIAGAYENWEWEAYPGHDYLHSCKLFDCCKGEGWAQCSKTCINLDKNGNQKCMEIITPEIVASIITKRMEKYGI